MLARLLGYALSYGNFLVAALVWWLSDPFIAAGSLLLGFIVFGIVRSKLRNDSVPPAQRELSYNDYAIATWYLSGHYCISYPKE